MFKRHTFLFINPLVKFYCIVFMTRIFGLLSSVVSLSVQASLFPSSGTNIHKQSRADFCRLAFKTNGFAKLYAMSQHIKTPGTVVYYSGKFSCFFLFYLFK